MALGAELRNEPKHEGHELVWSDALDELTFKLKDHHTSTVQRAVCFEHRLQSFTVSYDSVCEHQTSSNDLFQPTTNLPLLYL